MGKSLDTLGRALGTQKYAEDLLENPVTIGPEGVQAVGEALLDTHTATTELGLTRTMKRGMIPTDTVPYYTLEFHSPDGGELLFNGGFESDAATLDGWTAVGDARGSWSENTDLAFVYNGVKSAKYDLTATNSHGTLTLTTRVPVIALNAYRLAGFVYAAIVSGTTLFDSFFQVKWYTVDSGGSAFQTDQIAINTTPNAWKGYEGVFIAPATALYAEIVIDLNGYEATEIYFDNISFVETDIRQYFRLQPRPTVSALQIVGGLLPGAADDGTFLQVPTLSGVPLGRDDTGNLWQGLGINNQGRYLIQNTAAKKSIYTTTINADALGQSGYIDFLIPFEWFNNTGVTRTFTVDIDLGGVNILSVNSGGIISNATNARPGHLSIHIYNDGADTFQESICRVAWSPAVAMNTISGAVNDFMFYNTSTVSTAVDNVLTISITLSAAFGGLYMEFGGVLVHGPIHLDESRIN